MEPNSLLARLREWWQAQDSKRKIGIAAASISVVVTLAFFINIIFNPNYAPLFTQLNPEKAGAITEELEAMGVPYKLTNNGSTLEVPEEQVHQVRVRLANSGVLLGQDKGFELFDTQRFGISDFEQQVGYQRALQEELRRTIVQMSGVYQARVHLVIPEDNLFSDQESTPSAAVAIKLSPSKQLRNDQVRGVVDLVTGSVENLKPQNVNVIDMEGNILNDNLPGEDSGNSIWRSANRQQMERDVEKNIEERLNQMFTRILGPGSAVAMVTAELNFDQRQSTSIEHGPGEVVSEQNLNEEGSGAGAAAGTPGTDEGEGDLGFPGMDEGGDSDYSREETITNYEVDRYEETIVKSPGDVERLSISVVVNETSLGDFEDEEQFNEELNRIQDLVASAVGYDATRGDQISVSSMPFDSSLQGIFEDEPPASVEEDPLGQVEPWMAGVIIAGVLLLLVMVLLMRRKKRSKAARREEALAETSRQQATPPPEEPVVSREPDTTDKIRELAKEKPDEVSEIIKLWLKE